MHRYLDIALGLIAIGLYIFERQDERRENLTDAACNVAETMRMQALYWQDQYNNLLSNVVIEEVDGEIEEEE